MYKVSKVIMYKVPKLMQVLKLGYQLRAVLAMMATPLSWKSVFFCPDAKGRFTCRLNHVMNAIMMMRMIMMLTVKRRLALLEFR